MTETPQEQRRRILLASPETSPFQYDSALALGYEPESWNGMWKLPIGHPITWLTRNLALVREVVHQPGNNKAALTRKGNIKTRLVFRTVK